MTLWTSSVGPAAAGTAITIAAAASANVIRRIVFPLRGTKPNGESGECNAAFDRRPPAPLCCAPVAASPGSVSGENGGMSVSEATPDFEQVDRSDRAFLGHPKGLGFLGFTEACERFSYYSMQTLLTLYMVNYLLVPSRMDKVIGLTWMQEHVYHGISGQPLAS